MGTRRTTPALRSPDRGVLARVPEINLQILPQQDPCGPQATQTTSLRFPVGSRPATLRSSHPVLPMGFLDFGEELVLGPLGSRMATSLGGWGLPGGEPETPSSPSRPAPQSPLLCSGVCEIQIKWFSEKQPQCGWQEAPMTTRSSAMAVGWAERGGAAVWSGSVARGLPEAAHHFLQICSPEAWAWAWA